MSRILIVDDDPQFRRALRIALDSHGYEVSDVSDGKTALDLVENNPPDLIVLDWYMPGMDGIQTCRAVREHSSVPIIMVSAQHSPADSAPTRAGANAYLTKPFSFGELLTRIESALGH